MKIDEIAAQFDTKKGFLLELENLYGSKKPIKIRQKRGTSWKESSEIEGTFLNCLKAIAYGGKCGKTVFQPNVKLQKALKKMSRTKSFKMSKMSKKKSRKNEKEMMSSDMNEMISNFATKKKTKKRQKRVDSGNFDFYENTNMETPETPEKTPEIPEIPESPVSKERKSSSGSLTAAQRLALQFSDPDGATKEELLEMFMITGTPKMSEDMSVEELRRRAEDFRDNQTDGDLLRLAQTFSNSETEVSQEIMDELSNRLETSKSKLASIKVALKPIVKRLKEMASDPTRDESEKKEIQACIRKFESVQPRGQAGGIEVEKNESISFGEKIGVATGVALGAAAIGIAANEVKKSRDMKKLDEFEKDVYPVDVNGNIDCSEAIEKHIGQDEEEEELDFEQNQLLTGFFLIERDNKLNEYINAKEFFDALFVNGDLIPFARKDKLKELMTEPDKLKKYINWLATKLIKQRPSTDKQIWNCFLNAYTFLRWVEAFLKSTKGIENTDNRYIYNARMRLPKFPLDSFDGVAIDDKSIESIEKFFQIPDINSRGTRSYLNGFTARKGQKDMLFFNLQKKYGSKP